jgi:hypothetical protein
MLNRILVAVPFWRRGSQDPSTAKSRLNSIPARADFLKVTTGWGLSDYEARQLFGVSRGEHRQLKKGRNTTLAREQSARILLLAEIYKGLHVLYGTRQADAWVRVPNTNPIFGGDRPLDYMLQGGTVAVARVRDFVGCWSSYSNRK